MEVRRAVQMVDVSTCKPYQLVSGELCVSGQLVLRGTGIVIPNKLQPRVLALADEGHLGVAGWNQTEPKDQSTVAWS